LNLRVTQFALLLATAASVVIIVGLFDTAASLFALGAVVFATLLAAPAGRGPGGGWWTLMAIGTLLSGIGAIVAIFSEGLGGLIALLGGVAVISGSAIGFPLE
jgi:hypothetical protein